MRHKFLTLSTLTLLLSSLSACHGILELFQQKKRMERGWFPMNPKRKDEYSCKNERS